jgi:hypothetical protein
MVQDKENPGVAGRGQRCFGSSSSLLVPFYLIQLARAILELPLPLYAIDGVVIALDRGGLQ